MENLVVIDKLNLLKENYEGSIRNKNYDVLSSLISEMELSNVLSKHEISLKFIEDISSVKNDELVMNNTVNAINEISSTKNNFLISMFDIPYEKPMGLDAIFYDVAIIDPALNKYKSNAVPIIVKNCTKGFEGDHMVALFPENHVGVKATEEDTIFYLVNKFANRHVLTTQKIIEMCVVPGFFENIKGMAYQDIEDAVVYWIYLHEYHHQSAGYLPIPKYLKVKSLKVLAGLEELRVDIGGMLICYHYGDDFIKDKHQLFEFILSERLLRYGVDGFKRNKNNEFKPSYDALAGFMFFNLLVEKKGLEIKEGKILIKENIIEALESIYEEINDIELKAKQTGNEMEARNILLEFTKKVLDTDDVNTYDSHPFFDSMRSEIGHQL